jgi:D-lactate dehydrogenase (cytochrome)
MIVPAVSSAPSRRDPEAMATALRVLAAQFGNRLVTSQAVREQHGNTITWIENQPPDAVVFPQSIEDVQAIVRICAEHRVPVIPFGTGTSLEDTSTHRSAASRLTSAI